MDSNKVFIGIDPGKRGGVVVVDENGRIVQSYNTPLLANDKVYDKFNMLKILQLIKKEYDLMHTVLEDVHANQMGGIHNNFDLGNGKGLWEMAITSLLLPHSMIAPKTWQKQMFEGAKIQYVAIKRKTKAGKTVKKIDTKATSLIAATMLAPTENWNNISDKTGKTLSSINDGKVDAFLMAEFCRRNYK